MPPSPTSRFSPGRELRVANHRRGHSLEGRIFRDKDDDLVLFNDMQTKERDNFLLQSSDDFEDALSTKLRHFSNYKHGVSVPVRGESSDLLDANKEENDYDWLLTPPDTPLFRSLDDEPPPVNVARRGRPRSQPISISRSSTMEKSYRSSRGSASPNRLSTSPQSGTRMFQSRGRPSSAPSSSLTSSPHAPFRRPSPPPNKHLTPTSRSTTLVRRMSTGSGGGVASYGVRGISPSKTSRGNSGSPKLRSWQTNIPGFSTDAPPNLRTSLADRPASYVRGSTPASRNGRDATSKFSRRSMSPAASRSVSSSHSHDRDPFSSHSKGSTVSSGNDEVDSLSSIPVGTDLAVPKRVGTFPKAFPKKSAKLLSPSSTPKRSFDSALRQVDHKKSPYNMFRPLLSSVPSTTLYVGRASSSNRFMISRNSSITTSSNASSDHGASVPHDTEETEHGQDDVASECGKLLDADFQDEVFAFDKPEAEIEDIRHAIQDEPNKILHDFYGGHATECICSTSEDMNPHDTAIETRAASDTSYAKCDFSEVDNLENRDVCSKCRCIYKASEPEERGVKVCPECRKKDSIILGPYTQEAIVEISLEASTKISEESKQDELLSVVLDSDQVADIGQPWVSPHEKNVTRSLGDQTQHLSRGHPKSVMDGGDEREEMVEPSISCSLLDSDTGVKQLGQLEYLIDHSNKMIDCCDGAGISVLLNISNSSKGPVVQGKSFTATCIPYDEPSYARDSENIIRTSFSHQIASPSSVDFSCGGQAKTHGDGKLSEKSQSTGSSFSGVSNQNQQTLGPPTRTYEETSEVSASVMGDVMKGIPVTSQVETPVTSQEEMPVTSREETPLTSQKETSLTCQGKMLASGIGEYPMPEEGQCKCNEIANVDASASGFSRYTVCCHLEDKSIVSLPHREETATFGIDGDIPNNGVSVSDIEASAPTTEACFTPLNISVDGVDVSVVPAQKFMISLSEIQIEDCNHSTAGLEIDLVSSKSNIMENLEEPSIHHHLGQDSGDYVEPATQDNEHGILVLEGSGGSKVRSLTLEEATDTILFCSSIIHDLAYEAATAAMERESQIPLEESWPVIAVLGKSNTGRKPISGRIVGKHNLKSQKPKQRRAATDAKFRSSMTENDENMEEFTPQNVEQTNKVDKVDSMKPPKLQSKCNCTIM